MFANKYLEKQNQKASILDSPNPETGIIVVIPCFNEPDILQTLQSLDSCKLPNQNTEVIILINHSEIESEEIKQTNFQTKTEIDQWILGNRNEKICFFSIGPVELRKKWAGAGLARKSGMDEAILRFNVLEKPDGIVVSLDADTLVDKNYLVEIEKHFQQNPRNVGATVSFQHQTKGLDFKHLEGIQLYEKYLGYYKKALDFTGYPFSMFTIGSAFAVTADAYVRRGGMNRRQAGEDFYFLQNLAQIGTIGEIKTTKVYPSARLSNRVPFGTGPILQKWMNGEEDLLQTYNFQAFADLKIFFNQKEKLYKISEIEFKKGISLLPKSVFSFIEKDDFWAELKDLNQNCSSQTTFQSRFFQKFNAFKILKFLNFAHENFYNKENLDEQIVLLNQTSEL